MSSNRASRREGGGTARRRADVGRWVTDARKRTKRAGGGLVLPDYFESLTLTPIHVQNGTDYGLDVSFQLSDAMYERPDYTAWKTFEEERIAIEVVYERPDLYVARFTVHDEYPSLVGYASGNIPYAGSFDHFVGVGTLGQDTEIRCRVELVGYVSRVVFARTANEGEFSHAITLPAFYLPDISDPLPVPQYLYGTSPVDVGIHDKQTTVTVTTGDFPPPDAPSDWHAYNVSLEMETYVGAAWGGSVSSNVQLGVLGTALSTVNGTFPNLFPGDVAPYTPRRVRYKVVSGTYIKTGPWSDTFCYPPKFFPDTTAGNGITVGFDYETLQFTSHKLRVTAFTATGADSTASMRLRTRHRSAVGSQWTTLEYTSPMSTSAYDYVTSSAASTTGTYQLGPGDEIAKSGASVDVTFSVAPASWDSTLGGPFSSAAQWTALYLLSADARARMGFRNEWLDFTSAKQTTLIMPAAGAFDMSMTLVPSTLHWWQLSVDTFDKTNWPVGSHTDYRILFVPRRHQTNDPGLWDYTLYDRSETTGVKARIGGDPPNIPFAKDPEISPPRNYLWQSQWIRLNGDTYASEIFSPNRIIYTPPEVNSITIDTVAAGDIGAGYSVRVTAFDGFTGTFNAGEKATYDIAIYVSTDNTATDYTQCDVGPVDVSFDPSVSLATPHVLHTFDRTSTNPHSWEGVTTNDSAQTHKVFVVVGYTPNPANGEGSVPKIEGLHTTSVSGVNVPQIPQVPVPVSHWKFDGDLQNVLYPGDGATATVLDDAYTEVTPTPTGDTWFGTAATKRRIKLPGNAPTAPEIQTPYLRFSYPDDSFGADSLSIRQDIFWDRFTDTTYSENAVAHAFSVAVTFKTAASSGFVFNAWQPSDVLGGNTTRTGGYLYIYDNGLNAMMYKGLGVVLINGYASLTNASYNQIDTTNTHQVVMTFKRHFYSIGAPNMASDYTLKAYFDGQLRVDQTLNNSSEVVDTTYNTSGYYYCNRMGSAGNVTTAGGCEVYDYQMFNYELSDADASTLYSLIDTAHS